MKKILWGTALAASLALPAGGALSKLVLVPPLSCKVVFDQTWVEFELRNNTNTTIASGKIVRWRLSTGKTGILKLKKPIAPGAMYMASAVLGKTNEDGYTKCAVEVS